MHLVPMIYSVNFFIKDLKRKFFVVKIAVMRAHNHLLNSIISGSSYGGNKKMHQILDIN